MLCTLPKELVNSSLSDHVIYPEGGFSVRLTVVKCVIGFYPSSKCIVYFVYSLANGFAQQFLLQA